eukprot:scaffold7466_cov248-Pinguiococcus_pyrenoidosus.AAC.3
MGNGAATAAHVRGGAAAEEPNGASASLGRTVKCLSPVRSRSSLSRRESPLKRAPLPPPPQDLQTPCANSERVKEEKAFETVRRKRGEPSVFAASVPCRVRWEAPKARADFRFERTALARGAQGVAPAPAAKATAERRGGGCPGEVLHPPQGAGLRPLRHREALPGSRDQAVLRVQDHQEGTAEFGTRAAIEFSHRRARSSPRW